jgi:hypothetical protein
VSRPVPEPDTFDEGEVTVKGHDDGTGFNGMGSDPDVVDGNRRLYQERCVSLPIFRIDGPDIRNVFIKLLSIGFRP